MSHDTSRIESIIKSGSVHDKVLLYMEDIADTLIDEKPLLSDAQIDAIDESITEAQTEEYEDLVEGVETIAGALFELRQALSTLELSMAENLSSTLGNVSEDKKVSADQEAKIQSELKNILKETVKEVGLIKGALKAIAEYAQEHKLHSAAFERALASLVAQAAALFEGMPLTYEEIPFEPEMYTEYAKALRESSQIDFEEEECDEDDEDHECEDDDECCVEEEV